MADLNQRFVAYVKGLRETQAAGQPTQPLDSTGIVKLDEPNVRGNVAAKDKDLNTDYYLVIP